MTPDLRRLKLASKASIKAAGGLEAVASDLGKCTSQVGRYGDPNAPGNFMTLDQAATVEQIGGEPAIATFFASLTGHALFPVPVAIDGEDEVFAAMIAASAEFGDVASALRETTRDGEFDEDDRAKVRGQIDEAVAALMTMRALVGE
jgi:hypothetical protein